MKTLFCILILLWSMPGFAQPKEAKFKVISSKDMDINGVFMTIHLKVKGADTGDHRVVYYLVDHQGKGILHSLSDKQGIIDLNITNFKYIKYVYIGGPGHITSKIDLTQFKGKNVELELDLELDLRPLH